MAKTFHLPTEAPNLIGIPPIEEEMENFMFGKKAYSQRSLYTLIPHCPRPGFCLFLKFGQAIVIRVLMLNF